MPATIEDPLGDFHPQTPRTHPTSKPWLRHCPPISSTSGIVDLYQKFHRPTNWDTSRTHLPTITNHHGWCS